MLYFCTAVENGPCLVFHSSHVSLFFLPRIEKVSHDILGFMIIINSDFTLIFRVSKLSSHIIHKFSIIRALTPYSKGLSHFICVSCLEYLYFKIIYLPTFTFFRSFFFRLLALYHIQVSYPSRFLFYSALFTLYLPSLFSFLALLSSHFISRILLPLV